MKKSVKQNDIFLDAFEWESLEKENSQILYRYVEKENYDHIVLKEGLSLRFSDINNFKDKTEAKIINKYYQKALNNLKRKKKINEDLYKKLVKINTSNLITKTFVYDKNGISHYAKFECNVFIYCLSRKKNSRKMLKKYGKGSKCIGVNVPGDDILRSFCVLDKDKYRIEKYRVLYGKKAINYIENKISIILKKDYGDFEANISFIKDLLEDMQCYCKKSCYKYEDEVRIVLYENIKGKANSAIDEKIIINDYLSKRIDKKYIYLLLKGHTDINI